jgi:type I restriction enzyme S subunit
MNNWKEYKLGEIADFIDYRGKTPTKTSFGVPLITAKIVKNGTILEPTEYISNDDYPKWMTRGFPKLGDVVLTTEAPLGEVAQIKDASYALAQRIITLRGKEKLIDNGFLKYFLQSNKGQQRLKERETGTTVTGIKSSELKQVLISAPDYKTQTAIAEILSSLDDKIELNNKINQELENLAQTLFKQWFIDFEFPANLADSSLSEVEGYKSSGGEMVDSELGMIPKGWEVKRLKEILTIKRGGSPRPIHEYISETGLPWMKISDATAVKTPFIFSTKQFIKPEGLKKTILMKKGSLILSNSATPGLPKFLEIDACIHDGWLHFQEIKDVSYNFLYLLFISIRENLVGQGNGSIFINLKTDILKEYPISISNKKILNDFEELISPIFDKIKNTVSENNEFEILRDTLLPKLISGELEVAEAHSIIND